MVHLVKIHRKYNSNVDFRGFYEKKKFLDDPHKEVPNSSKFQLYKKDLPAYFNFLFLLFD